MCLALFCRPALIPQASQAEEPVVCHSASPARLNRTGGMDIILLFLCVGRIGAAQSDKGLVAGSLRPLDRSPLFLSTKGIAEVSYRGEENGHCGWWTDERAEAYG